MINISNAKNSVRKMLDSDLEQVLYWRNNIEVRSYMLTKNEISFTDHQRWFERVSKDPKHHVLIFEKNKEPLGFVQFEEVISDKVSNWGFYAAPYAQKGTGSELGKVALNYAFSILGLHKVCGQALSFNMASIQLHLKLGFQQEGLLREHHLVDGSYCDLVCFGILAEEWVVKL